MPQSEDMESTPSLSNNSARVHSRKLAVAQTSNACCQVWVIAVQSGRNRTPSLVQHCPAKIFFSSSVFTEVDSRHTERSTLPMAGTPLTA